ncbi:MAG: archaellin/type IV pilin N-terminal domain-containing protein [Candidatus Nanopusillus sp.]
MKSISPIIASILIIVITVAIAGIFYAFTSGMFGSLTQSSSQQIQQQSQITSFTINTIYCSNNILYFDIYNKGNIPININNSQIIFTDNYGNTISVNGSNIICNNRNIIPSGSNSLCYIINNYFCYYSYTDYIKSTNFVYNGINYNYEILNNNKFNIIYLPNSSSYPMIIYNTQSISTLSPFQQDIAICNGNINVGSNFAYVNNATLFNEINPNGQNVLFFNPNSNQLLYYSWYEGQLSNGSTYCDVWWINIPQRILANSNVTIYMYIGNSSSNYYSQYYPYVGETPQLSPTYAEYDNGNYVFNYYWDFAGTSLPNNLICTVLSNPSGASGSCSVNNGVSVVNTNGYDFWVGDYMITYLYYSQLISIPTIVEAKVISLTGNSGDSGWTKAGILYQNQVTDSSTLNGEVDMIVTDGAGYAIQWQSETSYIAPTDNYNGGSIIYPTIIALVFPNTSYACGFYGSSLGVLSQEGNCVTPTSRASQGYIGLFVTSHNSNGLSSSAVFQYLLVRAYPPNGIMPSIYIS